MNTKEKNNSISNVYYAGFWIRFVAHILDSAIISIITLPFIWYIGSEAFMKRIIFIYLASLYYFIFLTYRYNTTIAKSFLKIKITSSKNNKLTLWQVILRELFGKFISSITLMIGYIAISFDDKKQGFHDKISKTLVIYTSEKKPSKNRILLAIALFTILTLISFYVEQEIFGFTYST